VSNLVIYLLIIIFFNISLHIVGFTFKKMNVQKSNTNEVVEALSVISKAMPLTTMLSTLLDSPMKSDKPMVNYDHLALCLSDLASCTRPENEQVSNELVVSLLDKHQMLNEKRTGRASLTYSCLRYLHQLPSTETEARKNDTITVAMLKLIGLAYNNFNVNDATQERDMGVFRSVLHKKYGESYAYDLIKRSKISNSTRTVNHMKESKAIRNERHEVPLVLTVTEINTLISKMVNDIWPNGLDKPVISDVIPLLFELCTGARTSEVTSYAEFKIVSTVDQVTFIEQTGCLKQKESSDIVTIVKPVLLHVDVSAMIRALDLWRSTNELASATNRRLNSLLQTKYLSSYVDTHRITTHLLRTVYANMAYETIVKTNAWQLGVCTLNKFLNDALGHHSLEMGLAYLHVVIVDDRYEALLTTLKQTQNLLYKACLTLTV